MTVVSIGSAVSAAPITVPAEQTTPVTPGITGPQGETGAVGTTPWQLPPLAWQPTTSYSATPPASTVIYNDTFYFCITTHTSGLTFDSTKWMSFLIIDGGTF